MSNEEKSKELIKGTGIYAIGTFGTKLLSFIIVPLYTYYISTEDMGIYDLLVSTVSLLAPLVTLQISDAAYRWIIRNEGSQRLYILSTMQVLICNCVMAGVVILTINKFVSIPYCHQFVLVLITTRMLETTQKLLRALRKQRLFAVSGIVYSIVFLALNLYRICISKEGIICLLQDSVIASSITILLILFAVPELRINLLIKPHYTIIKDFYKFSIPLVPNYLNWWVMNSSDRYIVAAILGVSSNGILAITHKFPSLLQTILNLFNTSWQDVSIADKDKSANDYYTKVFGLYSKLILSFMWILIPLTKVFILFAMSASYKMASNYVAFYYLGAVFQSFASFYGVGYIKSKKTKQAFYTSIYGALINAVTNLILIKFIGLQASAVSTFLGFLIMWLIREYQNRDELGISLNVVEIVVYTTLCICVSVLSIVCNTEWNMVFFIMGAVAFIILNRNELKRMCGIIIERVRK